MSTSLKSDLLDEISAMARAMGAPHRLAILEQLAQDERGVDAIAAKIGVTIANCSQHLQHLRRAGLVTSHRNGKSMIYRLTDARTLVLMEVLGEVAERNVAAVRTILRGLSDGTDDPEPITRSDLETRLRDGAVTLIDVRPGDEYRRGHIAGAVSVPVEGLAHWLAERTDSREIVAYCRGPCCIFAHQAVAWLRRHGLNARRLTGGLPEWRAEGREICAPAETSLAPDA